MGLNTGDSNALLNELSRLANLEHDARMFYLNSPSFALRPNLVDRGTYWEAYYGEDNDRDTRLSGKGLSPMEAFAAFDREWYKTLLPKDEESITIETSLGIDIIPKKYVNLTSKDCSIHVDMLPYELREKLNICKLYHWNAMYISEERPGWLFIELEDPAYGEVEYKIIS